MPVIINGNGSITGLSVGGLPNGTVNADTLATDAVTTNKIANSAVTSVKASGLGISMIDSWRLTTSPSYGNDGNQTGFQAATNMNSSSLGSALTYNSGDATFSFPSTGHYLILFTARFYIASGNDGAANIDIQATTDNGSSYTRAAMLSYGAHEGNTRSSSTGHFCFDVTNTTNCRFKIVTHSMGSSSHTSGDTNENQTYFQVIRLSDT